MIRDPCLGWLFGHAGPFCFELRRFIQRRGHRDVNDSGQCADIASIGFKCQSSSKESLG